MHGSDTISSHGRNVATSQHRVVHARVHGQLLGEHGLSSSRRAVEQQIAKQAVVQLRVLGGQGDVAELGLEIGLKDDTS